MDSPIDFQPSVDFEPETPIQRETAAPPSSPVMDTIKSAATSVASAISPELTTAIEAFNSPVGKKLQDLSEVPYQGLRGLVTGAAQVVPALRSGDTAQLPTPQAALQRASEATQPGYTPQTPEEKAAQIGAQIIEPRSLLASKVIEAAGPVLQKGAAELGKQYSKLQEVLTAVDDNNFKRLFTNPREIMTAGNSQEKGRIFQAAKEAAGLTAEDERSIATKEDFRKSIYNDVMSKIDRHLANKTAVSQGPSLEAQDLRAAWGRNAMQQSGTPLDIVAPYVKPEVFQAPPVVSTADLLKAKKAAQLMAASDPGTSGFFQNEIHTKINPMLKAQAPEVYAAQQAVHLAKVKESLLNLFPQGKGMMNYFRTISMLGGSLFHGIGMMESPLVQTGITLGARGLTEAASSLPARIGAGAAINRIGQNEANRRALQSVSDRIKHYRETEYAN